MIVAIASGKGGTGKTTVALKMAEVCEHPVQLAVNRSYIMEVRDG